MCLISYPAKNNKIAFSNRVKGRHETKRWVASAVDWVYPFIKILCVALG